METDQRITEWMKVMLGEIANKQAAAEAARRERERREAMPTNGTPRKPEEHDPAPG